MAERNAENARNQKGYERGKDIFHEAGGLKAPFRAVQYSCERGREAAGQELEAPLARCSLEAHRDGVKTTRLQNLHLLSRHGAMPRRTLSTLKLLRRLSCTRAFSSTSARWEIRSIDGLPSRIRPNYQGWQFALSLEVTTCLL